MARGGAAKALERAGRRGDGWLAYPQSVKGFMEGLATVRQAALGAGRDVDDVTPALMLPALVRSDTGRARRGLAEHTRPRYRREFPQHLVERLCLTGTAEECVERVRAYVAAGARHIAFNLAGPPESFADDAALLADDVVGALSTARAGPAEQGT